MGPAHDHGHSHAPARGADRRPIALALALVLVFMGVEVAAGVLASSLALLSDAAHMLTDAGALALALAAARLAARPPRGRYTFGTGRAEVLSAQVNGALLLAFGVLIGVDSVRRVADPDAVDGAVVLVVGAAGAGVNVACALLLARSERRSLNLEGARQHVLADLYGSLGAIAAGAAVLAFGFDRADPIAALVVCVLMLRSAWMLLRESGRVLLEAAPNDIDPDEVGRAIAAERGVVEVHDLHLWEVTSGFPALSAHLMVGAGDDCHARRRQVRDMLGVRFGVDHVTLQVEHESEPHLLEIEARPRG
ncbi:MAG: cation diffusion facilitator family transporter [Actinomycetota bacterium]|nr:cation diffusion facilitator family transporter [Actinomycetota bacterium]